MVENPSLCVPVIQDFTRQDSVRFCWERGAAHNTKPRGANNYHTSNIYFVITCDLFWDHVELMYFLYLLSKDNI